MSRAMPNKEENVPAWRLMLLLFIKPTAVIIIFAVIIFIGTTGSSLFFEEIYKGLSK
ncbi:hypothetical protein [Alteromonas mediterranea]|uniref:hypothetical protein n=1 Tax=Alteromonas mediterranea TaxID=314275 RepID=UPI000ACB4F3F|nr:hypothetical protein [Alteromonas mediterranea]